MGGMQPSQTFFLFSLGAYPLSYLFHTPLTNLRQLHSIPATNRIAQLHKEHTAPQSHDCLAMSGHYNLLKQGDDSVVTWRSVPGEQV